MSARGSAYEFLVSREKNIHPRCLCAREVERVVNSTAGSMQARAAVSNAVVYLDPLRYKGQQGVVLQSPFGIRVPMDLIEQCFTRDPLNRALLHPSKDLLNGLGLLSDSKLSLIIGEAIQTAGVEVYLHNMKSRGSSFASWRQPKRQ